MPDRFGIKVTARPAGLPPICRQAPPGNARRAGRQKVVNRVREVGWPKPELAEFHLKLITFAARGSRIP
jgi:hypothetical protein